VTGLPSGQILDKVVSHALGLGVFEKVNTHEYKSAPGKGLFCEIWAETIAPARSGLDVTSAVLTLNVRVRSNMISEPQDAIDPAILDAVSLLMDAYTGDFQLGGAARNIDLLAGSTPGLRADAGYLNQDSAIFRIMTITVPIIVNDCWNQEA
jgi:hypothetical protein